MYVPRAMPYFPWQTMTFPGVSFIALGSLPESQRLSQGSSSRLPACSPWSDDWAVWQGRCWQALSVTADCQRSWPGHSKSLGKHFDFNVAFTENSQRSPMTVEQVCGAAFVKLAASRCPPPTEGCVGGTIRRQSYSFAFNLTCKNPHFYFEFIS